MFGIKYQAAQALRAEKYLILKELSAEWNQMIWGEGELAQLLSFWVWQLQTVMSSV